MDQNTSSDLKTEHQHGLLFLLDGNNIAYRAFYALPDTIATSTGFPTNALYGFCSMVIKILSEYRPESVIVAWDSRGKTFRHEEFVEYKAQRKPMPDLLQEQWQYFEELCEAFGFVNLKIPGFEADDILATLARQADAEGRETVIVTGDRDALQLVSEDVTVMSTGRGITEVKLYDPEGVRERFGIPPRLIPDMIGLKGDTSDNIPGIPGIGEKTAATLLQQFGSIEEVIANTDKVSGTKRRQLLEEHREIALLSKKLALLDREAPIDIHAAEVQPQEPDREKLRDLFLRFEFSSLLDRLPASLPEPRAETTEAMKLEVRPISPRDLESALDWRKPVGLALVGEPGAERVRLGQLGGTAGEPDAVLLELSEPRSVSGVLRDLLARGYPVVHDFKRQALLQDLFEKAGHDAVLAAYLLAPGRRSYDLEELLAENGLPAYAARQPDGDELPGDGDGEAAGGDASTEEEPAESGTAAAEAVNVLLLADRQREQLQEQGAWQLFTDVELPLTRVLLDMERAGILLDCYLLGEISAKLQDRIQELEQEVLELAGEEVNLGSPQQLSVLLFEKLGLPVQRKTKTGVSTDAKTLEALKGQHPVIEPILRHRELSKLLSTYLISLPAAVDVGERLHTTFHQAVTATGRLSSSDPNLQNIPIRTALGAQIRECFAAAEDHLLVVADYSQIELRIMAYLSGEEALMEAFRRGEDIHARTAAEVFDLPEGEVDSIHRGYAKAVNFGIMYGISAFGLSQQLGISREEAGAYIERYFDRLPKVRQFIDQTVKDARKWGWVATVFGRRRPVPEIRSTNFQTRSLGERLAVNSIIQGSAADIIKVAMVRIHRRLRDEAVSGHLLLQVHDELVAEAPSDQAERVRDLMIEEMVAAYPMEPPLQVDAGIGRNWLAAK